MNEQQHPLPEVLGAFFEGRLDGEERATIVAHLATCDLCVAFLRGAAAARDEEEQTAGRKVVLFRRPRWHSAAAAVMLAAIGLAGGYALWRARDSRAGVQTLVAAAPKTYRTIEPRLTGFQWAELRHLRDADGSRTDAEGLRLAGAAGEVLTETENDDSSDARRAAGVASLLVRETSRATAELRAATTRDPKNAAAWNDLAAALYTEAVQQRRHASLADALAAAERAAELAPRMPEARFNRALILERMGLRAEGAAAWRESLAADPSSPWAAEAQRRLSALGAKPQARFRDRVATLEAAAAAADVSRVEHDLRDLPQEVRGWFESDVLGRWGDAELREHGSGATLLTAARTAAIALRNFSGDTLLADSVAAIDRARSEQRLHAARGHAAYRRGRLAYRDRELRVAERELLAAAAQLDVTGSPMSGMARIYAASVIFDQNRIDEAAALLRPLLSRAAGTHVALRGQAAALLGRCSSYSGRWSEALHHRQAAVEAFRLAREPAQVAESEIAIGEIHSTVGDVDKAWAHRLAALQILGDGNHGNRLLAALATHARGELRAGRRDAARALLRLEVAEAQRVGDPLLIADALKRRARLHADEDVDAAVRDLREARAWAARTGDSGMRSRFEAECALVEGVVDRARDPHKSAARLTAAIDFARTTGDQRLLPEALLERARTHRAAGRDEAAWADLAAAIEEVDERRTPDGGPGTMLDAAEALFDEAVDLLLQRGENERAFVYAERANARALFDPAAPAGGTVGASELPAGMMLVQFALLPRSVAAFALTRDGMRVTRQSVDRTTLESDVRTLRESIESRRPVETIRPLAARLHALLIAPLALDGRTSSLVIAGGRVLQSVPWAALWDAERRAYLVELAAITITPGAGAWRHHRARLASMDAGEQLLLVTSDLRAELDPLTDLRREISAIEAVYPRRETLTDAQATPSRFLAAAEGSDVVHYAGHARASALLLGHDELAATDIARARLPRTRLVVLAACNTLGDEPARMEGAPGLARAFLTAGVPTVVGTLWPVHDAHAATLFAALHERLRAGSAVPAALREAQLGMLRGRNAELAHPVAWAAAEVLGAAQ